MNTSTSPPPPPPPPQDGKGKKIIGESTTKSWKQLKPLAQISENSGLG